MIGSDSYMNKMCMEENKNKHMEKHHLTKKEEQNIRTYFFWSIFIKGAISLAEVVVGILVLIVPVASVGNFFLQIAKKELVEEPGDFIATHFISIVGPATDQLVAAGSVFIALYLLSRGLVKIFLIVGLLKNKLWSYPTSLVILGVFVSYQLYQIVVDHSPFIVALTLFDLVVMYFIWKEYKVVKFYEDVKLE